MAQEIINIGTADAKTGDTLFNAFTKTNSNFTELYTRVGDLEAGGGNVIEINQESDFPSQTATQINIESGYIYFIKSPFTTAKFFNCTGGSIFSGATDVPFITYSGSGYMFDVNQAILNIREITVACPNATLFRITGDNTLNLAYRIAADYFVCTSCIALAEAVNGGALILSFCNVVATTLGDVIKLTGTNFALQSFNRVAMVGLSSTAIMFNLGTAQCSEIEIENVVGLGDIGATFISGLPNSGNIFTGGEMSVKGCNVGGLTTPLVGVQENDIRVDFGSGNSTNLKQSQNAGDLYLTGGSETITVSAAGEWYEIGTPAAATWAGDVADRFQINSAGYIEYIGERPIDVAIEGRVTLEKSGGGADVLECRLAVNWDGTVSDSGLFKSRSQTQSANPTSIPIGALTRLNNGDNIRVIFVNNSGTANIIATVTSLEVSG